MVFFKREKGREGIGVERGGEEKKKEGEKGDNRCSLTDQFKLVEVIIKIVNKTTQIFGSYPQ